MKSPKVTMNQQIQRWAGEGAEEVLQEMHHTSPRVVIGICNMSER